MDAQEIKRNKKISGGFNPHTHMHTHTHTHAHAHTHTHSLSHTHAHTHTHTHTQTDTHTHTHSHRTRPSSGQKGVKKQFKIDDVLLLLQVGSRSTGSLGERATTPDNITQAVSHHQPFLSRRKRKITFAPKFEETLLTGCKKLAAAR